MLHVIVSEILSLLHHLRCFVAGANLSRPVDQRLEHRFRVRFEIRNINKFRILRGKASAHHSAA